MQVNSQGNGRHGLVWLAELVASSRSGHKRGGKVSLALFQNRAGAVEKRRCECDEVRHG